MKLPDAAVERLLDVWPVARLATVGEGGRPHQVPIVFARHGGALWSPVDDKPKPDREPVRIQNVRQDPRVSLVLDQYDANWAHLWWVRVDGHATVVACDNPEADPEFAGAAAALRAKYEQYDTVSLFKGRPTMLRIGVQTIRSWCASPDALDAVG